MFILSGLEAHLLSINIVDDHLYIASSIESYMLPSTVSQLKKHSKAIIGHLFDLKVEKEETKMISLILTF
ncbi:hypothetical protein HMPREF1544_10954 [Mucor circinelloides 1006PhL]|uniref:Uncharacterized protein n=1 Tax=Mucor circinelloides f. circinelloides (strain 1006PhL) TaxID=1220926 RepID=S2IYH0_MUCC1|nr:hypothetical protein HMPREF1544_10954 [Mucor circinelloides 1006PhL]